MLYAYINYPDPHITIHKAPGCSYLPTTPGPSRRIVRLDRDTLDHELRKFADRSYKFAPNSRENDMWLIVSLDSPEQEVGAVYIVQALLGLRYGPLREAAVKVHC